MHNKTKNITAQLEQLPSNLFQAVEILHPKQLL